MKNIILTLLIIISLTSCKKREDLCSSRCGKVVAVYLTDIRLNWDHSTRILFPLDSFEQRSLLLEGYEYGYRLDSILVRNECSNNEIWISKISSWKSDHQIGADNSNFCHTISW